MKSEKTKKQKNKFVRSIFGRICGAQICLRFYLTFRLDNLAQQVYYYAILEWTMFSWILFQNRFQPLDVFFNAKVAD